MAEPRNRRCAEEDRVRSGKDDGAAGSDHSAIEALEIDVRVAGKMGGILNFEMLRHHCDLNYDKCRRLISWIDPSKLCVVSPSSSFGLVALALSRSRRLWSSCERASL